MTITSVKIHPAIGIARVGNSPSKYFIGPELPGDHSIPSGGYKDGQCRVKRQAVRFRIFAYDEDGSAHEMNDEATDITWSVHLVNKKASVNGRNPTGISTDLIIDPGSRTLTGPNQRAQFDTGVITFPGKPSVVVPLGEIRTDKLNHLLVLGGYGTSESPHPSPSDLVEFYNNSNWYDDISDGPVTATVTIRKTGQQFTAERAWIIVAPPKFSPGIESVITLYDRLVNMAVEAGWLVPPKIPSYTKDIYPILERAQKIKWVHNIIPHGAHSWSHPVIDPTLRKNIFSRLTLPEADDKSWPEDMPKLRELGEGKNGRLTATQYQIMRLWNDGTFKNDWEGKPSIESEITPSGLDQAALENTTGGPFYPGIEAGGGVVISTGVTKCPINELISYGSLFRFHDSMEAGDITAFMALPWQADFFACGDRWWPVPRPNSVIPAGTSDYKDWDRDIGTRDRMVSLWHRLGFVVQQGEEYKELDRCGIVFVILITLHLDFRCIPIKPLGLSRSVSLPITFEIISTDLPVILEIESGPFHPRLKASGSSVSVGPAQGNGIAIARFWITYETGAIGESLNDYVVIRNRANNESWNITITANTIECNHTAFVLVCDSSQNLEEIWRGGKGNNESLLQATQMLVDTLVEGSGISLVRFAEDVEILQEVEVLGSASPSDKARKKAKTILAETKSCQSNDISVGNGIYAGLKALDDADHEYNNKAMIIFTANGENCGRRIEDMASRVNVQTYSVGFGLVENTNMPALQALSSNRGGYMLVLDSLARENEFLLQKYFLQIIGNINDIETLSDVYGKLKSDMEQRIPFYVTESDVGLDIALLARFLPNVDFCLQTPGGHIIGPHETVPTLVYVSSDAISYYRINLPVEIETGRPELEGLWHVILRMRKSVASQGKLADVERIKVVNNSDTISYNLFVQSYSNLSFKARLYQTGIEVGSRICVEATISMSGIPMAGVTDVWAEVTRPDGSNSSVVFEEQEEGRFTSEFRTTLSGIYRIRIRCSGRSSLGHPFLRERSLTAATWHCVDSKSQNHQNNGDHAISRK